jgi:hypothetical protein
MYESNAGRQKNVLTKERYRTFRIKLINSVFMYFYNFPCQNGIILKYQTDNSNQFLWRNATRRKNMHRLHMELDLRSLFGLHVLCTAVLIGWGPRNPPSPRIWALIRGRYWSAKNRRHLFVTPWKQGNVKHKDSCHLLVAPSSRSVLVMTWWWCTLMTDVLNSCSTECLSCYFTVRQERPCIYTVLGTCRDRQLL